MRLNSKGYSILLTLCATKGENNIKTLAETLKLSERTVRYELDKIDEYLVMNKYEKLIRKFGGKIYFKGYKEFEKKEIFNEFENNLDIKERREYLTFICIFDEKINLTKASEILEISRTTIRNDILYIKEELRKYNLSLEILHQEGLYLFGEEIDIRKLQLKFLKKYSDFIFYPENSVKTKRESIVENYIKEIEINDIKKFINYIQKYLNKVISDEAYNVIAIYIIVTILRIKQGKHLTEIKNSNFLYNTQEYKCVQYAKSILECSFDIEFSENEILQLTDYILGSHTYNFNKSYLSNWIEIDILVKKLIVNFNEKLDTSIDITRDNILFEGLLNHIKPTIYRLKNNIKLENSIYNEVINSYPNIFNTTKISVDEIEKYLGLSFSDDEIAFLSIYFKTAIDRNKDKNRILKKALIVCGYGYGTSHLLVQQIKEIYTLDIVNIIPRHLLEKTVANEKIDIIITTIDIALKIDIPVVKVNSILTASDIKNLDKYSLSRIKKRYYLSEILKIIENSCEIKEYNNLKKELFNYFEPRLIDDIGEKEYSLVDFLNEDTILLNQDVESWEEAIKIAGGIMVSNEIVSKNYVDKMIENVHKLGSYIVIGDKIAIPHAEKDNNVFRTGMSLVILKNPVIFPNDKEVQIILSFSSYDGKEHLNALAQLVELLHNKNTVKELLKIKNSSAIVKFIKRNCNL